MRILFLGDTNHPNAMSWIDALRRYGGVEVVTLSLKNRMRKRFGKLLRTIEWVTVILRVRRVIKQVKPDILISYRTTSYGFIGASSGFHPHVIAMQGVTDLWPVNSFSTPFKAMLARYAARHCDMAHAWGPHMAANILKFGISPDKVLVLPRGANTDIFYPPKEPQDLQTLRIVVTRSLFPEYRHTVILQAAAKLKQMNRKFELHIIGDGALKEKLVHEAERLDIVNETVFHGRIAHAGLGDILRNCNIYVSMPLSEGVSASLFEAMACGCFPIVCDLEANRFWVKDGENGFLIPLDDADMLAKRIAETQDRPDLYTKAREMNFELIREKATVKNNIATFISRYEKLIREAKANNN